MLLRVRFVAHPLKGLAFLAAKKQSMDCIDCVVAQETLKVGLVWDKHSVVLVYILNCC